MVYNEILFVNGLIIQWYLNRYTDNTILLCSYLNKTIPDALVFTYHLIRQYSILLICITSLLHTNHILSNVTW